MLMEQKLVFGKFFTKMATITRSVNLIMENKTENGSFYENGNRQGIGTLDNGKLIGQWNWYHTNGKIYSERLYTDGKLINIINCLDGMESTKGTLKDGTGTTKFI
jgi:antitoxin component YwqK of YwqJK toxin-antitoxin module